MMSHSARVQKVVEQLRATKQDGWQLVKLARIGAVSAHVMSIESCKQFGWNEVWVRMEGREFRGSAEKVATELCKLLQAPSKAVGEAAAVITAKGFDSLREPEMAALYRLDEETTFKAMEFLAEQGVATSKGDLGWFRTV